MILFGRRWRDRGAPSRASAYTECQSCCKATDPSVAAIVVIDAVTKLLMVAPTVPLLAELISTDTPCACVLLRTRTIVRLARHRVVCPVALPIRLRHLIHARELMAGHKPFDLRARELFRAGPAKRCEREKCDDHCQYSCHASLPLFFDMSIARLPAHLKAEPFGRFASLTWSAPGALVMGGWDGRMALQPNKRMLFQDFCKEAFCIFLFREMQNKLKPLVLPFWNEPLAFFDVGATQID